ncbi:MAG: class I SAM-dependent methyltransferase [Chloracidobacterium sp.]|nr:class I SAM-dependent methyltransferase [Chloracidobacterium sp.]
MMDASDIAVWEGIEVERSGSEAKKRQNEDLELSDSIVQRYLDPPADSPFPLEYAYNLLGNASGQRVLDYGCGAGENSVLIAAHGGTPVGVDISPELIQLAERRMALHGYTDFEFKVGSAHELPLEDESIDVVLGIAILHHLDLDLSSKEVFRVLAKGGRAIFFEPVRNSKFIRFVRNLIPYQSPDVSPYERPLTDRELKDFAAPFESFEAKAFSLPFVNLIEALGFSDTALKLAIQVDGTILNAIPFLNYYGSIRVIEMRKSG